MTAPTLSMRFQRGRAPVSRLQSIAQEIISELADPTSAASADAERAGLARADLLSARVEVTEPEQGAEPFLTPIIIGIAIAAGSKVAETLWTDVIWPRIRRRLGVDAIGRPIPPDER